MKCVKRGWGGDEGRNAKDHFVKNVKISIKVITTSKVAFNHFVKIKEIDLQPSGFTYR
jgi:hypothetical protein